MRPSLFRRRRPQFDCTPFVARGANRAASGEIALLGPLPAATVHARMTAPRVLTGTPASDGIAVGQVRIQVAPLVIVDRSIARDLVPAEVARLVRAVTATDEQLAALSARLESDRLHEGHLLLEAHRMMLRDDQFEGEARRLIEREEI